MNSAPTEPDELLPTRATLLSRLRDWEDRDSWQDFFDTYWRLIYGVALRAGLNATEAEEAVQEAFVSVAKQMPDFHYDPARGSFKAWLLQITRWRIGDQFRKRARHLPVAQPPPDGTKTETDFIARLADPDGPDLEAVWDEEWEKNLLGAALARVKRQVSPKHYQIFDAYVLKEWPVTKVRKTLGVSLAQVYLAKHRVGGLVKKELRRLEAQAT
ncbi:MAG: sigma-70 family RNA polymerase sigma factor [Verrucomicrobia bacterium]|nr:sigma-70 family RNA polymerase sigma factor [Verrucomicrobiota bacterium]